MSPTLDECLASLEASIEAAWNNHDYDLAFDLEMERDELAEYLEMERDELAEEEAA